MQKLIQSYITSVLITFFYRIETNDVLERYQVGFSDELKEGINGLLIINYIDGCIFMKLCDNAELYKLEILLKDVKDHLSPLQPSFAFLNFFMKNCQLFQRYLKKFLAGRKKITTQIVNGVALEIQNLLSKICTGEATISEVTLDGFIDLDIIKKEYLETTDYFKHSDFFYDKKCLEQDYLESVFFLLEICKQIILLHQVCHHYDLECVKEDLFVSTVNFADDLTKNCSDLLLSDSVQKLDKVKEDLKLNTQEIETRTDLFIAVKESSNFINFAKERQITGKQGKRIFIQQHRLVTTQLQHEDYDSVVLDQLLACFDYVEPFLDQKILFKELIDKIAAVHVSNGDVHNGIVQLKTVNRKINTIKLWFEVKIAYNCVYILSFNLFVIIFFLRESPLLTQATCWNGS